MLHVITTACDAVSAMMEHAGIEIGGVLCIEELTGATQLPLGRHGFVSGRVLLCVFGLDLWRVAGVFGERDLHGPLTTRKRLFLQCMPPLELGEFLRLLPSNFLAFAVLACASPDRQELVDRHFLLRVVSRAENYTDLIADFDLVQRLQLVLVAHEADMALGILEIKNDGFS
jgi:hypothetical protein